MKTIFWHENPNEMFSKTAFEWKSLLQTWGLRFCFTFCNLHVASSDFRVSQHLSIMVTWWGYQWVKKQLVQLQWLLGNEHLLWGAISSLLHSKICRMRWRVQILVNHQISSPIGVMFASPTLEHQFLTILVAAAGVKGSTWTLWSSDV